MANGEVDQNKSSNAVRKWTVIVLGISAVLLLWHLLSDRFTPHTSQARVRAYVVPLVPQVDGLVKTINVENNQLVDKGDVLVAIDDTRYELALQAAQAELEIAGQNIDAGTAGIESAEAGLASARAELRRAEQSNDRVQRIHTEDPGAVSKSERDFAASALAKAKAGVASAEAELDRAKQELGSGDSNNPRVRAAIAALESARFDLLNTRIVAPSGGMVTDLRINTGHYAQTGQPLMTFIAVHDAWIEAYFRENNLGRIKPGDQVEIALDVQPGRVYHGTVASLSAGVAQRQSNLGELPSVENARGWLREPQRFPVIIEFDDALRGVKLGRRVGSQADVIVYTGNNLILNALGWLWIRLGSLLSYAY